MKRRRFKPVVAAKGPEPFEFFPPRDRDPVFEGRDPHEPVKSDWMGRRFPRPWHLAASLFIFALGIYLASMSWTPSPGVPIRLLLLHLKMEAAPSVLQSLWGWGVRGAARLPGGLPVAAWMGLTSALCGAWCVALLGRLMTRVAYVIRNEPGPDSFLREAQARRLSGVVSGLYLACSIPFWVVSTRSLPGSFHLLLLLVTAWWFSEYQHWGKRRHLWGIGLFYGIGLTESPTFLVFLPLMTFLVTREMLRWRVLRHWRAHLVFWCGFLPGLSLYAVNAVVLHHQGLAANVYASPWAALLDIWKEQMLLIAQVRFSPGFLVAMFFCLAPWTTLFVMSRRSPWFYEWGQVIVRLIFIWGLMAALYNATFAPWALMGMHPLLIMPYVLMAISMGYMAGEFWIIGEQHLLLDFRNRQRVIRWCASALALTLPVVILGAGVRNWNEADGRHGAILHETAMEILDELEGPSIIISSGVLDDAMRMAVRERFAPVLVISAPRTSSPTYLRELSKSFREESLRLPLWQGNLMLFIENLMLSEAGPGSTAIIDLPDIFREFGYLLPHGFFYRIQLEKPAVEEIRRRAEALQPFWARMAEVEGQLAAPNNPARIYQDLLRLMASRVANNLGVIQAEIGDLDAALETFRMARRIYPENASVLLNLMGMARQRTLPEADDIESAWADRLDELEGGRWALARHYGHVWNARQWLDRGWGWALSGVPSVAEASRYAKQQLPKADEEEVRWVETLDKAYLQWKVPPLEDMVFYNQLARDPRNTAALQALSRTALRRGDLEVVETYMQEALRIGLPEEELLFDRAMMAFVRGDQDDAVQQLDRLSHLTPGDTRVWVALILLTEEDDPRNRHALWVLRNRHAGHAMVRVILGSVFMTRSQWQTARAELERAVELNPHNAQAWELLMTVAQETGHRRLMEASMKALIARDPDHYIQFQNQGIAHYEKGELAEAEQVFREGIRRRRSPILLNNLAHVIRLRDGNLQEALLFVNEAIRRQPETPSMYNTRAEIHLRIGNLPEARRDVLEALRRRGRNLGPLVHLIERYLETGNIDQVSRLIRVAAALEEHLTFDQKQKIERIRARLAPPSAD